MEVQWHLEPLPKTEVPKIFRVAVGAVGGQGGGAISEIIFYAVKFEREKHAPDKAKKITYETRGMIPGLAQRSGSTITSVTFVDPRLPDEKLPDHIVLTEMPHRGSCQLVVGQELNELMKFLPYAEKSGIVIVNEERQVTPPEKMSNFSPKFSEKDQIQTAQHFMKDGTYIGFKGRKIIKEHNLDPRMLNTFMLGIISEMNALPISRESYVDAISRRFSGKVLEMNLSAFHLGELYFREGRYKEEVKEFRWEDLTLDEIIARGLRTATEYKRFRKGKFKEKVSKRLGELGQKYPYPLNKYVVEAYAQLTDFQNMRHAEKLISLIDELMAITDSLELLSEYVQNISGRIMQWDGPVRVAEYAVRDRISPKTEKGTLFIMEKKLQPTVEELVGMVPIPKFLYGKSPEFLYRIYERNKFRGKSMNVKTTSFFGFLTFWFLKKLKPVRPKMIRYHREMNLLKEIHMNQILWTQKSQKVGLAHAKYIGKIRGYSYVRHRHLVAYREMMTSVPKIYEKYGEDIAVSFMEQVLRTVSNAGQGYDEIKNISEDYLNGNYQLVLTPTNVN